MNTEEIAQFRSYLTSQSMKRTPVQIYGALEAAYRQLLETVDQSHPYIISCKSSGVFTPINERSCGSTWRSWASSI